MLRAMTIHPVEATTPEHAERLRQLRDECRAYMTGSTGPITPEDQQRWFAGLDRGAWWIFLYAEEAGGQHVAYGLLRLEGARWLLTFGVAAAHRGRGLGKAVARDLLSRAPAHVVWTDVREDNAASLGALRAAGFTGGVVHDGVVRDLRWDREPTIVLTIPTLGNRLPGLRRQLESVAAQRLVTGDQVIVVVDGAGGGEDDPCCPVGHLVREFAAREHAAWVHLHHEEHNWGNPQRNHALDHPARADLIVWNDDDDLTMPGAWDAIRRGARENPGKVLMFRFLTVGREVLWERPGDVRETRIGGHCIVTPNVPGRVGRWGRRYEGDFDYITSTLALTGGAANAAWIDQVIATARPDPA
jgi:L-amino acid N-acyltransferase YncA